MLKASSSRQKKRNFLLGGSGKGAPTSREASDDLRRARETDNNCKTGNGHSESERRATGLNGRGQGSDCSEAGRKESWGLIRRAEGGIFKKFRDAV